MLAWFVWTWTLGFPQFRMDHQQNRRPSATISQQFQPVLYPKKSTGTYIWLTVYSMSQPIVLVARRTPSMGWSTYYFKPGGLILLFIWHPGKPQQKTALIYLPGFCYIPWYFQCSLVSSSMRAPGTKHGPCMCSGHPTIMTGIPKWTYVGKSSPFKMGG